MSQYGTSGLACYLSQPGTCDTAEAASATPQLGQDPLPPYRQSPDPQNLVQWDKEGCREGVPVSLVLELWRIEVLWTSILESDHKGLIIDVLQSELDCTMQRHPGLLNMADRILTNSRLHTLLTTCMCRWSIEGTAWNPI